MPRMKQRTFQFREDQIKYLKSKGKNAAQWLRIAVDERMEREINIR